MTDDAEIAGGARERDETQHDVLGAVLEFNPSPVSFDELVRYLAPRLRRVDVADALGELRALGLVHVIAGVERRVEGHLYTPADEFVLASRAAARVHGLHI